MGCSDVQKLNYEPEELSVDSARSKTKSVSSQLLEMIGVKGKVTQPGPGLAKCDDEPDAKDLYIMNHPWSVYGVSNDILKQGMENLRKSLPERGWKILKDGETKSVARDPEILAENKKLRYAAHIVWMRTSASGRPMINVTVVSGCFRAPAGTDINKEY